MKDESSKVNIFRTVKTENPFAQIDKRLINDKNLSWKTKGILIYLLSKPNDWTAKIDDIIVHAKDGRDSVRSAIQEAMKAGYIIKIQSHNKDGKFTPVEYQVFEHPTKSTADGFPANGKTVDGKTAYGKPDTTNIDNTNKEKDTNKEKEYISLFSKFWDLYPKRNGSKVGKKECEDWWKKNVTSDEILKQIMNGVKNFGNNKKVKDGYAEDPIRFLKHKRFMDYQENITAIPKFKLPSIE